MQLNMYSWIISENTHNIRQGVITANTKTEAESYLIASMDANEKELYNKNELKIKFIHSYKEIK